MNQNKGYYSLIQFCPDPSRLEGINIGVLIYSPESGKLKFRLTENNQRIRKVFGKQDWDFLNRAKESVEHRLETERFATVSDLESYISKRANLIQLTPLRPIRISEIEHDVLALYKRLVGPDRAERKPRIATHLSQRFFEAGVEGLVEKSVSVEIPDFDKPIRVPFGYQNGRFNLISPIQFRPDAEDILTKAGKSAIEGQLLYKNRDPKLGDMRLVVVAKFAEKNGPSSEGLVKRIFDEHQVKLYTFANIDPLVEDIKKSAMLHSH
jgi:Protein of unknown function (DUF3037)